MGMSRLETLLQLAATAKVKGNSHSKARNGRAVTFSGGLAIQESIPLNWVFKTLKH